MRSAVDQLDYLFLTELSDGPDNRLVIEVAEGVALEPTNVGPGRTKIRARPIEITPESMVYSVVFDEYLTYSVRNESFTTLDEYEIFEGRVFRTFSRSRFLDFVAASTIATDDYPGPYSHYQLVCCDHVLDVATTAEPIVCPRSAV